MMLPHPSFTWSLSIVDGGIMSLFLSQASLMPLFSCLCFRMAFTSNCAVKFQVAKWPSATVPVQIDWLHSDHIVHPFKSWECLIIWSLSLSLSEAFSLKLSEPETSVQNYWKSSSLTTTFFCRENVQHLMLQTSYI